MRTYIAALPLATEPAARAALVARADAGCERLQPVRDELLGADAALAKGTSQVVGGGDDGGAPPRGGPGANSSCCAWRCTRAVAFSGVSR